MFAFFTVFAKTYQPTDPLFPEQFYINNKGKYLGTKNEDIQIDKAWNNGYFGEGVKVCVIDDGCNYEHADLNESFDFDHSFNFISWDEDPMPLYPNKTSGTVNAGIIAAKENDVAIIGIAKNATLGCFNLDNSNRTMENIYHAIEKDNDYWQVKLFGFPARCFDDVCLHLREDKTITKLFNEAPKTVNFVQPGGSDAFKGGDTNFNPLPRNPRVIVVSDTTNRGTRSAWSNRGTNILVSAPVGGSSSYDHITLPTFPGLSASGENETIDADPRQKGAASVAAAIAILLQIKPDLSWREIQAIIAESSTVIDPNHPSWIRNSAEFWYSHIYGFGRLDIEQLIYVSDSWTNLDDQVQSEGFNNSEEVLPTMRQGGIDKTIEIDDTVKSIEYVELSIALKACDYSALRIQLFSPEGSFAYVKAPAIGKELSGIRYADFTVRNFFGENAKGTWKIHLVSDGVTPEDTFINATLRVSGVSAESKFQSFQEISPNPYKNIHFEKEANVTLESNEILCGVPFNVSVELPKEATSNITVLLGDQTYHSRWPLLDTPVNASDITTLQIPCFFKRNSKMNLTVESPNDELWGSKTITVKSGGNQTMEMINPNPYSIFRIDQNGALDLTVMPKMNLLYWIDGAYSQRARIQLYDVDAKIVTYETDLSTINNINLHIDNATKCPRCILSFVPNWYSTFNDDCLNIIQPISIIDQFDDPPEPWILPLNDACPVPSGIFTPTPTPLPSPTVEPSQSPVPRRTDSPTATVPGEGSKQNKIAIIVGISFICVFGLFLIIFLFINRRKNEEGRDTIDFSLVE